MKTTTMWRGERVTEDTEELDCGQLGLTELPDLPPSLIILCCQNNRLRRLPELPASLIKLNCHGNLISELPELPLGLTSLVCRKNKMASLPALPPKLETLKTDPFVLPALPKTLHSLDIGTDLLHGWPFLQRHMSDYLVKIIVPGVKDAAIESLLEGMFIGQTAASVLKEVLRTDTVATLERWHGLTGKLHLLSERDRLAVERLLEQDERDELGALDAL